MFPILIKLGPFTLHSYGLMMATGFLLGYMLARRRFERLGLSLIYFDQLIIVLMISGLLGARIFYFLSLGMSVLKTDPMSFFRLWEGGLVFYGGFVGGLTGLFIYARQKEWPILAVGDALVAPLLLGQALGRIGCFLAGCCYGRPTHSVVSLVFSNPDSLAPLGLRLIPTQIYSSLGDLSLFLLALGLEKKSPRRGILPAFYFIGYGGVRFLIEFLRGDERGPFFHGLSPSQWISIAAILVGVQLWLYAKKTKRI